MGPADVDTLRESIKRFGFGFLPRAICARTLGDLAIEADERAASATKAQQSIGVKYRASIAPMGCGGRRLLFAAAMLDLLLAVTGERVCPSEDRSCATFYGEGDRLGPHRDQPAKECSVTAIVYVSVRRPSPPCANTGLVLRVYGEEMHGLDEPRLSIPTAAGTLVIGRGARFWHERPALQPAEHVAALTACYAAAPEY